MVSSPATPRSFSLERAVCAGCGCLCDDIRFEAANGRLQAAENACEMGSRWLERFAGEVRVEAFAFGRPVAVDEALQRSADLLRQARAPAMIVCPQLTLDAMRRLVRLSMRLQAPLLPAPDAPPGAERSGIDAPECAATLGEVRSTADVVVFWRADPARTHPRHPERYSMCALPGSESERTLVVVDGSRELASSMTAARARLALAVDDDLRFALELSMVLEGAARDAPGPSTSRLAEVLRGARHAHIFLGAEAGRRAALRDALHSMAARARGTSRWTVSVLPRAGNARGLEEVATWLTGCPGPWTVAPPPGNAVQWLPGGLARPGADGADVFFIAGAGDEDILPQRDERVSRVTLGMTPDPEADCSFTVPGLDPRLRATVVRSDGVHLTLCGEPRAGDPDPTVDLLERLEGRVFHSTEAAP